MRSLLDINVIIALLDPDHAFHERAHGWWGIHGKDGWASCPLTENGAVRILSSPGYSQNDRFTPGELISTLREFVAQTDHEFWEDSLSLRDENIFAVERIHGSRQLTDLYLLALAVDRNARLVTFDEKIPLSAVHGAHSKNLCIV
jgi:hypothetical protein